MVKRYANNPLNKEYSEFTPLNKSETHSALVLYSYTLLSLCTHATNANFWIEMITKYANTT